MRTIWKRYQGVPAIEADRETTWRAEPLHKTIETYQWKSGNAVEHALATFESVVKCQLDSGDVQKHAENTGKLPGGETSVRGAQR